MTKNKWILLVVGVCLLFLVSCVMLGIGFLGNEMYHRFTTHEYTVLVNETTHTEPVALFTEPPTEPATEPIEETTVAFTEDPNAPQFDAEALQLALESALEECPGKWAVYAEELNSGASIFCGKDTEVLEPMIAASMIKMFIMAKTYELIELGTISEWEVYEDMFDMITISDNDDTNRLTTFLGGGSATAGRALVTDYAARIGCPEVKHNRLMLDFNGYENYVSVGACAKLLRMIYEGTCVSEEASEKMMKILLSQTDRMYIPAGVPEGIDVAVKGGDLPDCQGDCGIVFLEGNPYIVCIISNGSHNDFNTAKIGELSGLVYEAMAANIS